MRTLVWFTAGFALAAGYVCLLGGPGVLLAAAGALLLLAAVRVLFRGRAGRAAFLCLLGLAAGLLWCAAYEAVFLRPLRSLSAAPQAVTVQALEAPRKTSYGYAAAVRVPVDGRSFDGVLYTDSIPAGGWQPGDRICCTAKLKRTGQDGDLYARARGDLLTLSARGLTVAPCGAVPLSVWPARLSQRLQAICAAAFPADVRGLAAALLTGVRTGLSDADTASLRQAGVYHAVAISGMHVSILVWLLSLLCRSRKRTAALGIPVLLAFVLMTGASPSAVRAGLMQALLLLAPLVHREYDGPTSLAGALLVLLVQDPWCIASVGLQLSFAAVLGLLLFSRRLERAMQAARLYARAKKRRFTHTLARAVTLSVSCSLSATVFTLPLSAAYFGMLSIIAPLSNLLILWAVTALFAGGLVVCLLGLVSLPLAAAGGWLLAFPARYVLWMARLLSRPAYAAVLTDEPYWAVFAALYGLALLLLAAVPAARRRRAAPALVLAFCVSAGCAWAAQHTPAFTCTALDVGQGQSLVFQRGSFCAIIDCGGWRSAPNAGEYCARTLLGRGQRRVDALILTHYDADHTNGAAEALRELDVETLLLPDLTDETGTRDALCAAASAAGTAVRFVTDLQTLSFDGGRLQIFPAEPDPTDRNSGICVLASAGEYDILITGDLNIHGEQAMLARYALPQVELLAAGHHGAATSTSYALLARTRPETVLVSVGADNPYGHPSPDTLERIQSVGAQLLRTDQLGTITIRR